MDDYRTATDGRYARLALLREATRGIETDFGASAAFGTARGAAFKQADLDKDGVWSVEEFAKLGKIELGADGLPADQQALFSALDRNGDRALDNREAQFSPLFSQKNLASLLDLQAETDLGRWAVAAGDADGSGGLSLGEFSKTVDPVQVFRTGRPQRNGPLLWESQETANQRAFNVLDTDGDGQLSAAELQAKIDVAKAPMAMHGDYAALTGALLRNADRDGDAALSAAEIGAAQASGDPPSRAESLMAAADSDGDGRLTHDELKALQARRPALAGWNTWSRPDLPSAGEVLFARLLRSTAARLAEQFATDAGAPLDRKA